MCITARPALLSSTIGLVSRISIDGFRAHVVGYQNTASSSGPNAMLLHFPASEVMTERNMTDCSSYPHLFNALVEFTTPTTRSGTSSKGIDDVEVFQKGNYYVVLARDARAVGPALIQVPKSFRPEIPAEILEWYATHRPGYQLAVCCWRGEFRAEPLIWWYRPFDPSALFFPAADAHDGSAPRAGSVVRDHTIFHPSESGWLRRRFLTVRRDVPQNLHNVIPERFIRSDLVATDNGDFIFTRRGFEILDVGVVDRIEAA